MELQQLKYFMTAAETQHISKAAGKLNIAQPALSQSIRRLESELGVRLFDRKGRSICLNEQGRDLVKTLKPILETLDELPARMAEKEETMKHTIRINALAASRLVTDVVIAYKALHPEIHFKISQETEQEDWDVQVSAAAVREESSRSFVAFEEEFFLAVPQDSPYGNETEISLNMVREEAFITLTTSKPYRELCDRFWSAVGIRPEIAFESDSPEVVRELIGAGLGVAFWPAFSWGKAEMKKVRLLPICSPICKRDIILMKNSCCEEDSRQEDFFRFLLEYLRQFCES